MRNHHSHLRVPQSLYAPKQTYFKTTESYRCKQVYSSLMILFCSTWFCLACEDPVKPVSPVDMYIVSDMFIPMTEPDQADQDFVPEQDMEMTLLIDMAEPEPDPVGWIEIALNPARTYYQHSDQVVANIEVYDIYGNPYPDAPITAELFPALGQVFAGDQELLTTTETQTKELTLTFTDDGETELIICSAIVAEEQNMPICASRPLLVDQASPRIEVLWPPRGMSLSAQDSWPTWQDILPDVEPPEILFGDVFTIGTETNFPDKMSYFIPVYGRVLDLGLGTLMVNDVPVTPDERGYFTALVDSKPGYRAISIVADDGVRFTPAQDKRWILFAEDYIAHDDLISPVSEGLKFAIGQNFIDANAPAVVEPPYQLHEVAQLLNFFLGQIDPNRLITQSNLITSPELSIEIDDLSLGSPNIDLRIADFGLSLFAELNDVRIDVEGSLNIGSSRFDLGGYLEVGMSAFADYDLTTGNQALDVDLIDGSIAVTHITPHLNEPAANTIVSVLDSTARTLIVEQIEGQMQALLQRDIPLILEQMVQDIYQTIAEVPLDLNTGLEGTLPLSLLLKIDPVDVQSQPYLSTTLIADVQIENQGTMAQLVHQNSRGVPKLSKSDSPVIHQAPILFQVRPELVNSILAEVWRSGLLDLKPPLPASASLFFSEVTASALSAPIMIIAESHEPFPLYLELGALQLALTQTASGNDDIYEAFVRVGGHLEVNQGIFTVGLEQEPHVEVTLVELGNERPAVTEQLIANLITQQLWPSLSETLISSLVLGIPDAPLYLNDLAYLGISIDRGWLRPRFEENIDYQRDWITLFGQFMFEF